MSEGQVNASSTKGIESAAAGAKLAAAGDRCWVSDSYFGPSVTQVKESNSGNENMYWLNYSPSGSTTRLEFIVTFNPKSPLRTQTQSFFFPNGYGGGTTTPFGVPNWGGNPIHGKAMLTVIHDSGCCTYDFEVVPA